MFCWSLIEAFWVKWTSSSLQIEKLSNSSIYKMDTIQYNYTIQYIQKKLQVLDLLRHVITVI